MEEWRRSMRARLAPETVEELESHLRDAIGEFVKLGRSESEAFELAAKRLGSVDAIFAEYQKREGNWWAVKAAMVAAVVFGMGMAVAAVFIAAKGGPMKWLLGAHVFAITTGYLGAFIVGAMGICFVLQRCWRPLSPITERTAVCATVAFGAGAAGLTAAGLGLGMIWAQLEWGRFYTSSFREFGGLAVLTWLLLFVAFGRGRLLDARAMMIVAILGNVVALFGWFGAYASDTRQWTGIYATLVWGGTLLHLIMAALGFSPAGCLRRAARSS